MVSDAMMPLDSHFLSFLSHYTNAETDAFVVAYSGGLDSHVLLHLCVRHRLRVRAVHVHHGLQAGADGWAAHCQSVCDALGVALAIRHVDARPQKGDSPEAAARQARYRALQQALDAGEILMTAQHRNDQAETFLLQLLRAGDAAGLSAMPEKKPFGKRFLLRPLLSVAHERLLQYARRHGLRWVEDPSNRDTTIDRNFLRHDILPAFRRRWPDIDKRLADAARHQQHSLELLESLAHNDLRDVQPQAQAPAWSLASLPVEKLLDLGVARQRNALRYWLKHETPATPSRHVLQQLTDSVLPARDDATPCLPAGAYEIRRFRQALHVCERTASGIRVTADALSWVPARQTILRLDANRALTIVETPGGLCKSLLSTPLSVRYRQGGERIKPAGEAHHRSLKALFQREGVPPWQRGSVPLVFAGERLIAVAGLVCAAQECVAAESSGFSFRIVRTGE